VPWLFDWEELLGPDNADFNRTFDVALHIGTFVGAAAYFRADLVRLGRAALRSVARRSVGDGDERLAWLLLVSSLPGAVVGAVLEATIGDALTQIWLIAVLLIVFGLVLLAADRSRGTRRTEDFRLRDALIMGIAQSVALSPGVSRSGITITAGRWLGFDRDATARLSFLMSLPIIGGAALYQGVEVLVEGGLPPGTAGAFVAGIASSGVTGAAAVWGVLRLVRTRSFTPFVVYRVVLGASVLGLLASRFR
jgi:undecaprenyl-diphosphatase